MKHADDQTHYDLLGVPFSADSKEIQAAYNEILSIYENKSLSTYSLFSKSERQSIRGRIQEAYKVLMDVRLRQEYDRDLTAAGQMPPADEDTIDRQKRLDTDTRFLKEDIQAKSALSGADLKSVRTSIHLKLDEIFAVTRIPVAVLGAIEEDRIQQLPPAVYLKGYVKQYAECLGLDPSIVLQAYLNYLKTVS